jgi:DNA-binding XRE family transcriptional regulator
MEVYWNNALTVYQWPKINIDSDAEVEERCMLYFEHCRNALERPTIEGLSVAIGVSPTTLLNWEKGVYRDNVGSSRLMIIKKSKALIQYMLAQMAVGNKIYPNVWIFYGKNWFGMKDIQDITITANNALQPTMSMEEIAEKVKSDVVIDTDYTE